MRKLALLRYPKLELLGVLIIITYVIFSRPEVSGFFSGLENLGYFGAFIAGLLFSYGFTSPFAAGIFITLNPSNVFVATILGGIGAMLSDLFIFNVIRFSFIDEFNRLKRTGVVQRFNKYFENGLLKRLKVYLLYTIAGIFIASPLPDEAGIIILSGMTRIKQSALAPISFVCNTLGILILLLI